MKKIYLIAFLLLNLLPYIRHGEWMTTGSVMAQAMGDEIIDGGILTGATVIGHWYTHTPIIIPDYSYPTVYTGTGYYDQSTYNPCYYGGCPGSGSSSGTGTGTSSNGNTTTQPKDTEKPADKPKEVDCPPIATERAKKAAEIMNRFFTAPDLAQTEQSTYVNYIRSILNSAMGFEFEVGTTIRASGNPANPTYYHTGVSAGSATQINFSMYSNTVALLHTHPMQHSGQPAPGPSPQDFVGLIEARLNGEISGLDASIVMAYGGAYYALVITNPSATQAFYNQNYRDLRTTDGMFREGTTFRKEYFAMNKYLTDQGFSVANAHDAAMAYVLDKNNTGVTLLKKDKDSSDFKAMHTAGTAKTNGDINSATSTKCK